MHAVPLYHLKDCFGTVPEDPDVARLSMLLTASHHSRTVSNDGLALDGVEWELRQMVLVESRHRKAEPSHN